MASTKENISKHLLGLTGGKTMIAEKDLAKALGMSRADIRVVMGKKNGVRYKLKKYYRIEDVAKRLTETKKKEKKAPIKKQEKEIGEKR